MANIMTDAQIRTALEKRFMALYPLMYGNIKGAIEHINSDITLAGLIKRQVKADGERVRFLVQIKNRCVKVDAEYQKRRDAKTPRDLHAKCPACGCNPAHKKALFPGLALVCPCDCHEDFLEERAAVFYTGSIPA